MSKKKQAQCWIERNPQHAIDDTVRFVKTKANSVEIATGTVIGVERFPNGEIVYRIKTIPQPMELTTHHWVTEALVGIANIAKSARKLLKLAAAEKKK